jgi:hypothetical protein
MNFKSIGNPQAQKDNPGKYRTRLFGGVQNVVIYISLSKMNVLNIEKRDISCRNTVTLSWKGHNDELIGLFSPPAIKVRRSRKMRYTRHGTYIYVLKSAKQHLEAKI